MKKIWVMFILVVVIAALALPAFATRREGIGGFVEHVDSQKITVAGKSYRIGKQFRVVIAKKEGNRRYERVGQRSDVRVGDKVSGVVLYDEITDIYLERY
ncbi:MAG: hypothetical protein M0T70_08585 [Geobacteraceae bacterium]|nr:hypothetical protein [Geobacteraceae bacterium]